MELRFSRQKGLIKLEWVTIFCKGIFCKNSDDHFYHPLGLPMSSFRAPFPSCTSLPDPLCLFIFHRVDHSLCCHRLQCSSRKASESHGNTAAFTNSFATADKVSHLMPKGKDQLTTRTFVSRGWLLE